MNATPNHICSPAYEHIIVCGDVIVQSPWMSADLHTSIQSTISAPWPDLYKFTGIGDDGLGKAFGITLSSIEVAHLEVSGHFGLVDIPRSGWDFFKLWRGCKAMLITIASKIFSSTVRTTDSHIAVLKQT
ncbi:hypothetical protein HK100_001525 [Physocladia obscura]|uniref:Uncharacterized protein n=1 Tax=Physocladia obscura TaxID=109957 RepID=A0AAD5SXS7_9FUNG|nr:hypothetical protein HK100_001525 [Physocladia obscura]